MLISGSGFFFAIVGIGGVAGLIGLGGKLPAVLSRVQDSIRSLEGQAVLVLLAFWVIAAVNTIDPDWSPVVFGLMAGVSLLLPLLAHGFAVDEPGRDRTLKVLIVSAFVSAGLVLYAVHVWPQIFEILRYRKVADTYRVLQFLKSYGAVIPLMTLVMLWAGWRFGKAWRWAAILYVPVGIYIVYLVANKSATLAYAGGIGGAGLCYLLSRLNARAAWIVGGLALAFIAAVLVTIFASLPDMPYTKTSTSTLPTWMVDAHRQVIWSFVLEAAGERPWFGWGLGTAGRLPGAKEIIPGFTVQYVPSHPHSWVLQVLVESGVLALAAAWIVIILAARHLVRLTADGRMAALAAAAVLGGFLASSLVNFSFFADWWQIVFVLLLSFPLSAAWAARDRRHERRA